MGGAGREKKQRAGLAAGLEFIARPPGTAAD